MSSKSIAAAAPRACARRSRARSVSTRQERAIAPNAAACRSTSHPFEQLAQSLRICASSPKLTVKVSPLSKRSTTAWSCAHFTWAMRGNLPSSILIGASRRHRIALPAGSPTPAARAIERGHRAREWADSRQRSVGPVMRPVGYRRGSSITSRPLSSIETTPSRRRASNGWPPRFRQSGGEMPTVSR